jgi:hypothetical protein
MWEGMVAQRMSILGKTEEDLGADRKGADWKVEIAKELRAKTTAGNPWIGKQLNMGHPSRITNLIRESTE